jgi:hypothetical protein
MDTPSRGDRPPDGGAVMPIMAVNPGEAAHDWANTNRFN